MGLFSSMNDDRCLAERVRRAASGDVEAQQDLLASFRPLARATANRLVDDAAAVDDVVQDALAEVLVALPGLRHPEAFPAWVRLSVRKHAERHRRSRRPSQPLSTAPEIARSDDPTIEGRELARNVQSVLSTLRNDDRHLLELRYLADWSITELADALGISTGAARKRLHDARRRARPSLSPLMNKEQKMSDHEQYLGRTYAPGDLSLDHAVPSVARPERREPMATGLKILDTVAPIARGGTVELVGPAGSGHLVLILELSYRLNRTEREAAIVAVGSRALSRGARSNVSKLVTDVPEHGRHAVIECAGAHDAERALGDGRALAHGLAGAGIDVLLVVDRATADFLGSPAKLKDLAGVSAGGGSITLILLDPYERGLPIPADAGMDTRLVFSLEHVALGIYPALDPAASRAHFLDQPLAEDVRRLLDAAAAVRQYFAQPMYAATEHTGVPATWVDAHDAEEDLRRLLGPSR